MTKTLISLSIIFRMSKDNNASNAVIMSILHKLENQSLTIMEDTDTLFLSTAMNIAERLEDRSVADKIHSLLLFGDNYKFIGDNQKVNQHLTFSLNTMTI